MAVSKVRRSSGRQVLLLSLLAGAFWMTNAMSGGIAGGQPPKDDPVPPPPTAILKEQAPRNMPTPSLQKSGGRLMLLFTINPDTPLKDLLPIPPKAGAVATRLIDDISQVPEVAIQ